jgi:hypothetical protein
MINEKQKKELEQTPEVIRNNLVDALEYAETQSSFVDFHLARIERLNIWIKKIENRRFLGILPGRLSKKILKFKRQRSAEFATSMNRHIEHRRVLEYLNNGGPMTKRFDRS